MIEIALEREYWRHVTLVDTANLHRWLTKVRNYINLSQTEARGRLYMLSIFGNLLVYSDGPIFDPRRLPLVGRAVQASNEAVESIPDSPNVWAFFWAIRNFIQWTAFQKGPGLRSIDRMLELSDYGAAGAAGPIGAAVHLMGARDKHLVRSGIQIYRDCEHGICTRLTSIAPFQDLGALVTEAEAVGYLGDIDGMHERLDQVLAEGEARQWPFVDRIETIRTELTEDGGLLDRWAAGEKLGEFRAPLGRAHRPEACAYCHAGVKVPDHYYLRVSGE